MPEKKVRLNILGLSYSQTQSGAYALILGEESGKRRLPVVIGANESQSIAIQLEGMKPLRPLTHDLFTSMAIAFHIDLIEVNIIKLLDGIFYSELVCKRKNTKIKIDSRTSDAIALAIRFKSPIYVTESIMRKAGILIDENTGKLQTQDSNYDEDEEDDTSNLTSEELKDLMNKAIADENYEKASFYRDEIKKKDENKE